MRDPSTSECERVHGVCSSSPSITRNMKMILLTGKWVLSPNEEVITTIEFLTRAFYSTMWLQDMILWMFFWASISSSTSHLKVLLFQVIGMICANPPLLRCVSNYSNPWNIKLDLSNSKKALQNQQFLETIVDANTHIFRNYRCALTAQ